MWIDRIKARIINRVPQLKDYKSDALVTELISSCFVAIINYSNANKWNTSWDGVLVESVILLYNKLGNEDVSSRSVNGIADKYISEVIYAPNITRHISQALRPVGYQYCKNRYGMPE